MPSERKRKTSSTNFVESDKNLSVCDDRTQVVAVFGNPVRPTPTPRVLNELFRARRLNFVSLAFESATARASATACKELGFAGAAVTLPFKEEIVKFLDEMDEATKSIGAANTIAVRSGRLFGHNTDWVGFLRAIRLQKLESAVCVILGAGGAARAAAYAAVTAKAEAHLLNRTAKRAKKIVEDLKIQSPYSSLAELDRIKYNILINATSVGLYDADASIVGYDKIRPDTTVVDFVFDPVDTKLLQMALSRGCRVIDGISILAEQAAEQIRIWTRCDISARELEHGFRSNSRRLRAMGGVDDSKSKC